MCTLTKSTDIRLTAREMFGVIQIRPASVVRLFRGIRTNSILRDTKPPSTASSSPGANSSKSYEGNLHVPSNWERKILVWSKVYPNKESVPPKVPLDTMQKAMSRTRIRIANYMMLFTILGCLYVVIIGKLHVKEVTKDVKTEHDNIRRQITSEYRASLETEKKH